MIPIVAYQHGPAKYGRTILVGAVIHQYLTRSIRSAGEESKYKNLNAAHKDHALKGLNTPRKIEAVVIC